MPFTPAHTAVLFPLRKLKLHPYMWTGLVIGSMVPDTEYFIWMDSAATVSHTLIGLFSFDLPVSLILALIWHAYLRDVLLQIVPFLKRSYYAHTEQRSFREWLMPNLPLFCFWILVAAASHLAWDGFTHSKGFMVRHLPELLEEQHVLGMKIRLCYILWYISTVVGMLVAAAWIGDPEKLTSCSLWTEMITPHKKWWTALIGVSLVLFWARFFMGLNHNIPRHVTIIAISSVLYAVFLVSFYFRKSYSSEQHYQH